MATKNKTRKRALLIYPPKTLLGFLDQEYNDTVAGVKFYEAVGATEYLLTLFQRRFFLSPNRTLKIE
jgi:hypothetical protein